MWRVIPQGNNNLAVGGTPCRPGHGGTRPGGRRTRGNRNRRQYERLLVGTAKGGFWVTSDDRRQWKVEGPFFKGWKVTAGLAGWDAPVSEGDTVVLMQAVSGG